MAVVTMKADNTTKPVAAMSTKHNANGYAQTSILSLKDART
jgi:hypothetical protein